MLDRFSTAARRVVALAEDEAQRLGHAHVGTEHLLLGILAEGESSAARALAASGATLEGCRDKIAEAVPVEHGRRSTGELPYTDRARRALERAGRLSLRNRDDHVDVDQVLLSLLDVEGTAGQALRALGADLVGLRVALGSQIDVERSRPARDDGDADGNGVPRCPACGSSLDAALAHRVVISRGEARQARQFVVAYCSACGSAVGATAV